MRFGVAIQLKHSIAVAIRSLDHSLFTRLIPLWGFKGWCAVRTLHTRLIASYKLVEPVVFVRRRTARDEIGDLPIAAPNLQRLSVVELSIREDEAVEGGDVSR